MELNNDDRWVAGKLAALEPRWNPDPVQARAALERRLDARPRPSWTWVTAAATAALCLAALAFPATRAVAQSLWYRLILNRIDIVRVDLSKLPLDTHVTTNGLHEQVQTIEQAEQKAGFRPHLPPPGVMSGDPVISVIGAMGVSQTIHVKPLEAVLAKAGATDVRVPAEWEGVTLRADIGPMVEVDYPGELQILQTPPIELSIPAGFPLDRFAETAFRSLGVSWWEARLMGRKFAEHPAWLLDADGDEVFTLQEIHLKNGTAMVIEDFGEQNKLERVTVILSTPSRLYSISSPTRQLCLKVAETLP